MVYTAVPGSESHEKLQVLAAFAGRSLTLAAPAAVPDAGGW
jgi:hypothetical protein